MTNGNNTPDGWTFVNGERRPFYWNEYALKWDGKCDVCNASLPKGSLVHVRSTIVARDKATDKNVYQYYRAGNGSGECSCEQMTLANRKALETQRTQERAAAARRGAYDGWFATLTDAQRKSEVQRLMALPRPAATPVATATPVAVTA